jgi:hypothetical protein
MRFGEESVMNFYCSKRRRRRRRQEVESGEEVEKEEMGEN